MDELLLHFVNYVRQHPQYVIEEHGDIQNLAVFLTHSLQAHFAKLATYFGYEIADEVHEVNNDAVMSDPFQGPMAQEEGNEGSTEIPFHWWRSKLDEAGKTRLHSQENHGFGLRGTCS